MRGYEGELTEQTENGRQDMSRALRVTLIGIVLILASLFVLGICVIDIQTGGPAPDGLALGLFVLGIIVSMIGIFFVKE